MSDVKFRRKMWCSCCSDPRLLERTRSNQRRSSLTMVRPVIQTDEAMPNCAETRMPRVPPVCWHGGKCSWHRRGRCLFRHKETPRDEKPLWTRCGGRSFWHDVCKVAGTYIPSIATPDCLTNKEADFKTKEFNKTRRTRQKSHWHPGKCTRKWQQTQARQTSKTLGIRPQRKPPTKNWTKNQDFTNDITRLKNPHRTAKLGNTRKATLRRQQRIHKDEDTTKISVPHLATSASPNLVPDRRVS